MGSSDEQSFENKLYSEILNCINTDENWFEFCDYNTDTFKTKAYVKIQYQLIFDYRKYAFFVVKKKSESLEKGSWHKNVDVIIVVSDLSDEENRMCEIDSRTCFEEDNFQLRNSDNLLYWIRGLNYGGLYGIDWKRRGQQCGLIPDAHKALVSNNLQPLHYYFKPPAESSCDKMSK